MNRFSRTEFLLLNHLYQKETEAGIMPALLETDLDLQESDEISRIRELVFYIEKLEREGVLETDPEFYMESDHMSFTYLNSAVELDESRVRLSDEGRRLITQYMASGKTSRFLNAYKRITETSETRDVLVTVSFLLFLGGLLVGYAVGRLG